MIRKIPRSCLGLFLLLRLRGVSATIRSAMLMLIVALLATSPLPMSAATPDPVLEWIGVINNAVIAGGTTPLATSRVVALVSASVFDAVNGHRSTVPVAACEGGRATSRVPTRSSDSGGLRNSF